MEAKHADIKKEIKKAERRGSRRGFFKRITAFLIGILCGMLIVTCASAWVHGKNAVDTFKSFFILEEGAKGHDLTLRNFRFFGYKAADFEDAILGEEAELKKLEVYTREVSDVVTLMQTGLGNIEAFSKYQYITYNGTAVYTVDLSKLTRESISLDEDANEVTIRLPGPVLEPINIQSENIEFGEVERKSIFAFGDIRLTPEEQARVETEAKNKMTEKLDEGDAASEAATAAEHVIWEIFQPVVTGVSPKYALNIEFE